jgi:hypothetical protein
MVRFREETDPSSIERIFPDKPEQVLGPGIKFVGARITITDAPVTTGIRKRLTWLTEDTQKRLVAQPDGSANPPFPRIIEHGHFRKIQK